MAHVKVDWSLAVFRSVRVLAAATASRSMFLVAMLGSTLTVSASYVRTVRDEQI